MWPTPEQMVSIVDEFSELRTLGEILHSCSLAVADAGVARQAAYLANRVRHHADKGMAAVDRLSRRPPS